MSHFEPTDEQKRIFAHATGLAKVYAGPGTGKTSTLLHYVTQQAAKRPMRILLLCFNKQVRTVLKERINAAAVAGVDVHTFHSLAYHALLPQHHKAMNVGMNAGLKTRLIRQALKGERRFYAPDPAEITELERMIEATKAQEDTAVSPSAVLGKAFHDFEALRQEHRVLFYEDWLQVYHQKLQHEGTPHYDMVLVDEAQDLNPIQFAIFSCLSGHAKVALMVGDVDQALYEWREASPEQLLRFSLPHMPCHHYTLSQTFRYGHHQAMVSQALISRNKLRPKLITTSRLTEPTSCLLQTTEVPAQAAIQQIKAWQKANPAASIAIISRLWAQLEPVQMALNLSAMPYQIKKERALKCDRGFALLQALATLHNAQWDALPPEARADCLQHLMQQPKRPVRSHDIAACAKQLACMPFTELAQAVTLLAGSSSGALAIAVSQINAALAIANTATRPGHEVLAAYYQATKLMATIAKNSSMNEETTDELQQHYQQLLALCQRFSQPLHQLANTLAAMHHLKTNGQAQQRLCLGTTHFHKGMEYDYVVIISDAHWGKEAPLGESERRSLYVAITRAKYQSLLLLPQGHSLAQELPTTEAAHMLQIQQSQKPLEGVQLPALRAYALKAGWLDRAEATVPSQAAKPADPKDSAQSIRIKQRLKHRTTGKVHQVMKVSSSHVTLFNPNSRIRQQIPLHELAEHYHL